ncbi:MAG: 16S rRNA (guanine(527)-N(7))-methyltransferase RsmG [Desulfobacterales bacterium]|nr:16S rRNA (guanine(527)-N(7))-methyltransferase RsmG [Desulfobacterales bacterium]
MEIGSREWQNLIKNGAQQLGIAIDKRICTAFATHAAELLHWNRKINLTTITAPRDIASKHFLDSLVPAKFIPEKARLLDIGAGGGFPGLPLKILKPSLSVLLIDGVRKKINFLKHVLRTLGMNQCEALHIRAEKLREDPKHLNSFDVIISRALSDLTSFVRNAVPLLAKQGRIIALKGEVDQKALAALQTVLSADRYTIEVEYYRLPDVDQRRSIVIIRPFNEPIP